MTAGFDNSIIGKAEYDDFVSSRAQKSSGWCLNCYFKIIKITKKKIQTASFIFVKKAKSNVRIWHLIQKMHCLGKHWKIGY